jgi:glycosyltransferase involved in cell wall biosynthesis
LTQSPAVSVVMPVYNARTFVSKAIESVLGQTFQDYELIVMDDGSTDGSREEVMKFGDRLTYLSQVNQGGAGARNEGVKHTRGRYLAFLDADDIWYPTKLQRCFEVLEAAPDAAMACSTFTLMSFEGDVLIPHMKLPAAKGIYPRLLLGNFLSPQGSFIRREVFERYAGYCAETNLYEDWPLWARISRDHEVVWLDEPLFYYRSSKPGKYAPKTVALRLERQHRVLDIAFREDPSLGPWFRARCRANVYMDLARACFFRWQFAEAGRLAFRSWLRWPLQAEVYTFFPRAVAGKLARVIGSRLIGRRTSAS